MIDAGWNNLSNVICKVERSLHLFNRGRPGFRGRAGRLALSIPSHRHRRPQGKATTALRRVDGLCGLRWRDLAKRDGAGQVTVYGKGGKTRVVLLSVGTWTLLAGL